MTPTSHELPAATSLLAITRTGEAGAALREACAQINGSRVALRILSADGFSWGAGERRPDAIIVEVDPRDQRALALAGGLLRRHFADTPAIATGADCTLQDVRQFMRHGFADFLPMPITRADLIESLRNLTRLAAGQRAPTRQGRIVTFLKGGGGAGATTLAVQSASAIATDRAAGQPRTCILDLDVQFGTVALYLDLDEKIDWGELLAAPERLDAALFRGLLRRHASGVSVLPAPSDMLPLDRVSDEFVGALLKAARDEFDYVFIDLPEAWTTWSYSVLRQSDLVVLVTQTGVSGIRQARRQLDTLRAHGLDEGAVRVVLNRFAGGWFRRRALARVEKALNHAVDFCVPSDYRTVSEALDHGVRLADVKRRSAVEKGVTRMVRAIVSQVGAGRPESRAEIPT
ncbi:MAG: AAA family ATPase [Alphaproteobacteria bacterium]|nr:AAA family ATPase [Alphaproteobacteria bacterium]